MFNIFMEYIDEIYAAREMRHEKVEDTFNVDLCRAEVVCARPGSHARRDQTYRTTDCLAAAD